MSLAQVFNIAIMIKCKSLLRSFICIILICAPIHALSQSTDTLATVSGVVESVEDSTDLFFPAPKLIEGNPHALPGATIKVMRPDSTIVKASSANRTNGKYKIVGIQPGDYILEAMYIGYGTQSFPIHLNAGEQLEKNIALGHIYSPENLPFGAEEAKADISDGIIEIRDASITIWKIDDEKVIAKLEKRHKEIQEKYGFVERDVKEDYSYFYKSERQKLYQANARYNQVVKNYLKKINGPNWEKRYQKELREACSNALADSTN